MTEKRVTRHIKIEGATLIFRNFRGEKNDYNDEGNRNFGVLLPDDLAEELIQEGWRVKHLRPKEDDPDHYEQPWLPVKVKFGKISPIIQLINSRGMIKLDEETIGQLDWTKPKHVDLVIHPYNYPAIKGRPAGVSAYLRSMYFVKDEDEFASKYANIPVINDEQHETER